jgi:hypothetical protein
VVVDFAVHCGDEPFYQFDSVCKPYCDALADGLAGMSSKASPHRARRILADFSHAGLSSPQMS